METTRQIRAKFDGTAIKLDGDPIRYSCPSCGGLHHLLPITTNHRLNDLVYRLIEDGHPVFPIWGLRGGKCECGDPYCRLPGAHPMMHIAPLGVHSATLDHKEVSCWWHLYESGHVGVGIGPGHYGVLVVH